MSIAGRRSLLTTASEIGNWAAAKRVITRRTPFSMTSKSSRSRPVTKRPEGSVTVTSMRSVDGACAAAKPAQATAAIAATALLLEFEPFLVNSVSPLGNFRPAACRQSRDDVFRPLRSHSSRREHAATSLPGPSSVRQKERYPARAVGRPWTSRNGM